MMDSEHISFFHFGGQCPYNDRMSGDAKIIARDLDKTFSSHDLMEESELAKKHHSRTR